LSDAAEAKTPSKSKKKTAPAFRRPANSVFSSVIAGADDVVANSFIAQGASPGDPTSPALPRSAPMPDQESMPAAVAVSTPRAPTPVAPAHRDAPAAVALSAQQTHQDRTAAPAPRPADIAPAATAERTRAPRVVAPAARASRVATPRADWAHRALTESFADAVISSNTWKSYGFRIIPDVLAALKVRLAADRRSMGNPKLAVGHYLDAAIRHAPANVDEQIGSAQAFLGERMGLVDSGLQSTYRVGPQARAWAMSLNAALQEADHGRKGIFVVSAALQELLHCLDEEGELQRPTGVRSRV
jgi:hypothetical protein